jgi:hypothetical protein
VRGLARELVLVSPRAGFGKAALLADWVRRGNRPVDQIAGAHSPTIPVWRRTRIPPCGTPERTRLGGVTDRRDGSCDGTPVHMPGLSRRRRMLVPALCCMSLLIVSLDVTM